MTPEIEHVRKLLTLLVGGAENMEREGLLETPARLVRALEQLTAGYDTDIADIMTTFPSEGDAMVVVRDIPFASLCEHHVLPFTGTVCVAYIPAETIVGLSKIPRAVRALTRRLQVQERIGVQLADALTNALSPKGVMVIVRARHTCMAIRGVESTGEMVTSVVRGVFSTQPEARAEAMRLMNGGTE